MAKIALQFPMRGANSNFAATTQPQFTSPSMSNVRTRDVLAGRARGGQRPGFAKAYNQHLGLAATGNNAVTPAEDVTDTTIVTTTMTGDAAAKWNTAGANLVKAGDVVRISAGTGPDAGDYRVASVTSDTVLVLATAPGNYNPLTHDDLAYTIERFMPIVAICQVTKVEVS